MEEEIRATYGTTRELKFTLKNADGGSRTLTLINPKTDSEALKTAVDNFAALVLNSETNIIGVDGYQPVSMVVDIVETERSNVGEYGQTDTTVEMPYLSQTVIELSKDTETNTIEVFNTRGANITVAPISGDTTGINTTVNQNDKTVTFTTSQIPEEPVYYNIELSGTFSYLMLVMIN